MDSSNINSNQEYTASSFFSYYREKRPEKFSDTVETYDIPLTKLLQKREMRKDIVIELSYKGFSRASDYS